MLHGASTYLKKGFYGLYPIENNWYYKNIVTYKEANGKYFRFITGDSAKHFAWCTLQLNNYNIKVQREIVRKMGVPIISELSIHHHYGMPSANSLMIGSYFLNENAIIPLLTNYKLPIFLLKVNKHFPHISIGKEKKYIVPHGWGKQFNTLESGTACLKINGDFMELHNNNKMIKKYNNSCDSFVQDTDVRNMSQTILSSPEDIWEKDRIYDVLYPMASYSNNGILCSILMIIWKSFNAKKIVNFEIYVHMR